MVSCLLSFIKGFWFENGYSKEWPRIGWWLFGKLVKHEESVADFFHAFPRKIDLNYWANLFT